MIRIQALGEGDWDSRDVVVTPAGVAAARFGGETPGS
jgi:hypothetical protein